MNQAQSQALASSGSSTNFAEKLNAISSTPATRKVRLVTQSCCGCGCSDVDIERTVPYNSPLNDGDRVSKIEDTDTVI
jgi:hypothetical protein